MIADETRWERGSSARRVLALSALALLGFVVLVGYLPLAFPVSPDVSSVASAHGYSTAAAFRLAVGWALITVWAARVVARRAGGVPGPPGRADGPTGEPGTGAIDVREILIVAGVVALVYFPPFLARYGPYIEENILLTVQHRMLDGQRPYVDFEFLYGPLMAYSAHAWALLFGFSLTSFYAYVAALEVLLFAALVLVLQLLVRDRKLRWLALGVLGALLFNTLIGPNWSGSRRLFGILAVVVVCLRPLDLRHAAAAGVLAGLQTAYSHDVGAAALAAVGSVYAFLLVRRRRVAVAGAGALAVGLALATWLGCAAALTGGGFDSYLSEILYLGRRFSAGEAGFRLRWTLNSVALFGLLSLACVVVGRGLARDRRSSATSRDLLLVAGLVFALVSLKSGLNRSDLFHLDAGIVVLALAVLCDGGRRLFHLRGAVGTAARGLAGVVAATYLFGLLPTGSYFLSGWARGLRDVVAATPTSNPRTAAARLGTRAPLLEPERSHPDPDLLDLARYLAAPERVDRPVFFYATTFSLGIRIGVRKEDFLNDDFLYSERRGERARRFLASHPRALVLVDRHVYERLYGLRPASSLPDVRRRFEMTPAKRAATWLSTHHYGQILLEARLKERRWRETAGRRVLRCYERWEAFGDVVVLGPVPACAGESPAGTTDRRGEAVRGPP